MNHDEQLSKIIQDIQDKYQCHTIILYGSRARGDFNSASDYDIVAIRDEGDFVRDCRLYDDCYLDAFIYSEKAIKKPDLSLIRMKDGIILQQKENIGDHLLKKIEKLFLAGPPKTADWEKHEIRTWTQKMLQRAKINDIEGHFRLHWLLHDLLECYFKLRDIWYLGPKISFQWLKINDLVTYSAFEMALKPNANFSDIENLINNILKLNENRVNDIRLL